MKKETKRSVGRPRKGNKANGTNDTIKKRIAKQKKEFIEIYKKSVCNISVACDKINIDRTTYYNWFSQDKDFKEKCEAVKESLIDKIEGKLYKLINEDNPTAIIFALKTLGKARGYVEKQEFDVNDERISGFNFDITKDN